MTEQQPTYSFSKYLDPSAPDFEAANKAFGELHAGYLKRLEELRRKIDWARASNQPLREVEELGEERQALEHEFRLMVDDYEHMRKEAALQALQNSSETLASLRGEVRELDEQLVRALGVAWEILSRRMHSEKRRNAAQQQLAGFSTRYPEAGVNIAAGRGITTSWGRGLVVGDNELARVGWKFYTERFAQLPTVDLPTFNKGK